MIPSIRHAALAALVAFALAPIARALPAEQHLIVEVGRSRNLPTSIDVAGVSLTDPNVADVQVLTPELILIRGLTPGATDLVMWDDAGTTQEVVVHVRMNMAHIESELVDMVPGSDLSVSKSDQVLVTRGVVPHADESQVVRQYLEATEAPFADATRIPGPQQVQVSVRIAEVSRTSLRTLGVNILKAQDDFFGGSVVGPSSGGPINPVSIGVPGGALADGDLPFAFLSPTSVSPSVTLFAGFPKADLEFFIQALAENEYLRILAEPNLVALNGEEASFLAGGEFPIPVVQGNSSGGGTSITIEYKEFGIALKFRPIVLGGGRIRMTVASEVSDISDIGALELSGFNVPAIVTRTASTTLELNSGETFAMAGLINETTQAQASRIPGLGDLPFLGPMFRSVRYKRGESELLLMVTANLVEPFAADTLPPLPGSDEIVPSDWELYVQGRLEGARPSRVSVYQAARLRELGFDRLRGPGAWMVHGQAPVPLYPAPVAGGQ